MSPTCDKSWVRAATAPGAPNLLLYRDEGPGAASADFTPETEREPPYALVFLRSQVSDAWMRLLHIKGRAHSAGRTRTVRYCHPCIQVRLGANRSPQ